MYRILPTRSPWTELVQSCFRLLDFRERIFVSHVSRAWRAVALNDRSLWNKAGPPETTWRCGSQILSALLARSDPLPFSLSWEWPFPEDCLPGDTADLVCRNMHRMQRLYVQPPSSDDGERLYQRPAPLLKHFTCQDPKGGPVLPAIWPRLEELRVVSLVLPAKPQPFYALRFFSCWNIVHFTDVGIPLFSLLPVIETLEIHEIITKDLYCLADPPKSLDALSLGELNDSAVDYAPLLQAISGLSVRRLRLILAQEASGVVELFSATARGPWRMAVDEHLVDSVELEDLQDRVWAVSCDAPISFSREPRLADCLGQLAHLIANAGLLVQLHNLDGWSRVLPALRTITIPLSHAGNSDPMPVPRRIAPVRMPLLGPLTLRLGGMIFGEIKRLLETHVPGLIPEILERPPSVVIDVVDPNDMQHWDLAPLTVVAQKLFIVKRRSGKKTEHAPFDDLRMVPQSPSMSNASHTSGLLGSPVKGK